MVMFIVVAKLAIPIGIPIKEARAETETHPLTVAARISKCSVYFKILQSFLCFYLLIRFVLFLP